MGAQPGDYGLGVWFEEHGPGLVHLEDLSEFRPAMPSFAVFRCVSMDGDFVVVQYKSLRFRVKPELFKSVAAPKFTIGDQVTLIKEGKRVAGEVLDIGWHCERAEPIYFLAANGRRLSKRYWESDLQPIEL